jgi:predicted nucleic acid-binding protein
MGATRVIAAAADSGPLIHLSEIGCIQLLQTFDPLHIPDGVWSETVDQNRVPREALQSLSTIQRHTLSQPELEKFVQENGLLNLQLGERECLFLCKYIGIHTLLTDDLAVREVAKQRNLIPVGSLGIIVKAYRLGHISLDDAEHYLEELFDTSSLYVTRAIVEIAIESLRNV